MQNLYKILRLLKVEAAIKYLFRKKLKIFMFHGIIEDNTSFDCYWLLKKSKFIAQINYLNENFNIISLGEAVSGNPLPDNSMVLTFDDGYKSMLTHVYPVLKERALPFTVYVTAGPVVDRRMLWTDRVFLYLYNTENHCDLVKMGIEDFKVPLTLNKKQFMVTFLNGLKKMDYNKKNDLIHQLGIKGHVWDERVEKEKNPFEMLTIDDVIELSRDPLVTIAAHTVNHEVLTSVPLQKAVDEIKLSKRMLEEWIQKPVDHFSYPDGKFNQALVEEVRKMGFKSATKIALTINYNLKNIFELGRIGVHPEDSDFIFASMVNGIIPVKVELRNLFRKFMNK